MGDADDHRQDAAPQPRTARARRIVRTFIVIDLVILALAVGLWIVLRDGAGARDNVFNDGLRGSLPPAGQQLPALDAVALQPPLEPLARSGGSAPTMLVATCLECQSGDVIGGFLGRLGADDLPNGVRAIVIGWDGNVQQWARRWQVDATRFELHEAIDVAAADEVRELLHVRDSGITFLAEADGTWRSTFHVGQLDRDDLRHDLERLADQ